MKALLLTGVLSIGLVTAGYAADAAAPAEAPVAAAAQAQQQAMKTIFDYQKEVGLTDKQVADMQKVMGDLQNTLGGKSKELNVLRQDLSSMIARKEDMKVIRKQMQKVADMQVENSCLDIEASRKVEQIMKPEQIAKWKEIQKKFAEEMMAAQAAAQQAPAVK